MTDLKKPRTPKTPRQRAEEALAVETRRVTKIGKKIADLKRDLTALEAEGEAARKRQAYLRQNPDLATPGVAPEVDA